MDEETLNSILQEKVKPDTTFLSELNNQEETEPLKEETQQEIPITTDVSEGKFHCKYSDGYSTDSRPELMSHYRTQHPEHKGVNRIKKEKELLEVPKDDNMTEQEEEVDETEKSLEIISPKEVETAKPKTIKKKYETDIATIPSDYDRLSSLLQSFGVPNHRGIIEGMKLYDIRDINILKDLLRNVSTPQGKADAVIRMWSEIQGINKPSIDNSTISSSGVKSSSPTDALSIMAKIRDEEMQDVLYSTITEKAKSKQLENELLRKKISGEYMENKNTPDISKIIELEMLKYQMMNPKTNPEIELLKLQMMQQPKTTPEVDMLKLEVERMKLQNAQPKSDGQVELLKQQIELQNKKYDDIQRKIDEDTKMKLLSDQHKQEMDILKQQIAEQSKQTQELMKTIQTSSAPKSEDILRQQMAEMQRQNDAKFQTVIDQLRITTESKREDEYRRTIESMKDQIKETRDQGMGAVGQVADSMKSFATDITHVIEKRELKDEYGKREDELKKKISDIEHNKSLTNEQYMMEKTTKIAEEAVKAIGGAVDGFGKALQPATKSAADSSAIMERAALAMDLKSKGFPDQTINNVLSHHSRPTIPSAQREYENLSKITSQMTDERNAMHQPIIPEVQQQPFEQQPETIVKFATSENEK